MTGETSQSWLKGMFYMAPGKREDESQAKGEILYKTIRSPEAYSLPPVQYGGKHPHDSITSYHVLPITHGN